MNLKALSGALMIMASIAPILAQSGSSINPLTTPQTAPMNVSEQQNLNMVLQWWREVIEAHHTELAEKYLAEDYIQHNPNVPTGRAAFLKVFSSVPPTNPIPEKLTRPPVVEGARGDFVWLVFEDEAKDPHDPSKTYHYDSFDLLRIQNGKVQEHWDSEKRVSGSPDFVASTAPAPSTWNTGKLSADEQLNIALATQELKDMLQYDSFDLLRIQNGKVQEHWDSEKRVSGSPDFVASTAPAPSTWNTGKLSADEQLNIALATQELKDMLQYAI